jgi:4-diphosphocytidyl-2-C-methyl-D-erythritol kinase
MYNSLEQPVFKKYPVLKIIQSELVNAGADGALLSGSGATVFAIVRDRQLGEAVRQRFLSSYGSQCWSQVVPLAVE